MGFVKLFKQVKQGQTWNWPRYGGVWPPVGETNTMPDDPDDAEDIDKKNQRKQTAEDRLSAVNKAARKPSVLFPPRKGKSDRPQTAKQHDPTKPPHVARKAGTSEGAHKAWEVRHRGADGRSQSRAYVEHRAIMYKPGEYGVEKVRVRPSGEHDTTLGRVKQSFRTRAEASAHASKLNRALKYETVTLGVSSVGGTLLFEPGVEEVTKAAAHPGFKAVQRRIAAQHGVSMERAGAILAAGSRGASRGAKKHNPRLKRV